MTARRKRRAGGANRPSDEVLSEQEREWIRRTVQALPQATESEIDSWCEVILNARYRAEEQAKSHRPNRTD